MGLTPEQARALGAPVEDVPRLSPTAQALAEAMGACRRRAMGIQADPEPAPSPPLGGNPPTTSDGSRQGGGAEPVAKMSSTRSRASRKAQRAGADAEAQVSASCVTYGARRTASVRKIPTEFGVRSRAAVRKRGLTLRPGEFLGFWVAGTGVDFAGSALVGGVPTPVRFEVKSSAAPRIPLKRQGGSTVSGSQRDELELAAELGGVTGVLVRVVDGRLKRQRWFWIPLRSWQQGIEQAAAEGKASFNAARLEELGVECARLTHGGPDWLAAAAQAAGAMPQREDVCGQ